MGGQRTVRRMLLLMALAAAVILGLLGMHTLGGHEFAHGSALGGGAADAPVAAVSHEQHPAAPAADVHRDTVSTSTAGIAPAPVTCAGCADLPVATTACVLVLLGGILLLVLPSGWRMPSPPSRPLALARADIVRTRAPSLHVLCISRT